MTQAQEYLSQAEWTILKNADSPLPIVAKLHRSMAMLQMAQENYDDALRNLANDVRKDDKTKFDDNLKHTNLLIPISDTSAAFYTNCMKTVSTRQSLKTKNQKQII